jgi:fluoride exporter
MPIDPDRAFQRQPARRVPLLAALGAGAGSRAHDKDRSLRGRIDSRARTPPDDRPRKREVRRPDVRELAAIALGGAAGALLRVWLVTELDPGGGQWPWATFAVNVAGSALLGYLATRLSERLPQSTYRRPLAGTGFCGAFTTFSTVQVEVLKMLESGRVGTAAGYAAASIAAGYLGVWLATAGVRRARVAS